MNKSLCLAPWNHIQINAEGIVNPCCMFYPTEYHKKYNNLQEAFDGSENKDLRQRMLNGEKIEGCSKCDLYESMNKLSYREHFNRKYAIEDDIQVIDAPSIKNPKIRELEFALDNTCNFKCVTCSSRFSSKWYEDDLELIKEGISRHSQAIKNKTQILRNVNNLDDLDLSELNYLKLIGGEPFINDRYVDILKKLNLENQGFKQIITGSVVPQGNAVTWGPAVPAAAGQSWNSSPQVCDSIMCANPFGQKITLRFVDPTEVAAERQVWILDSGVAGPPRTDQGFYVLQFDVQMVPNK